LEEDILKQKKTRNTGTSTKKKKRYASKEEVLAALEDAYTNTTGFHERILHFALNKIRLYFHDSTFRSVTAEDVVQDVLTSIIEQRRKWYRDTFPDFHKFVRMAILSHIRNETKKKGNLETTELLDQNGNLGQEGIQMILREYAGQDVAETDFRQDMEVIFRQCRDQLKDDVYATFVLEEICNGLTSNIKIAETLGVEVHDVENAKKRIKNRLRRLVNQKTIKQ